MAKKIIYCIVALMLLATSSAGADDGSRIVVDAMGRRVEVPPAHQVRRVIALGSSMAFVTFMGAQDRVVGVEDLEKMNSPSPISCSIKSWSLICPWSAKGCSAHPQF